VSPAVDSIPFNALRDFTQTLPGLNGAPRGPSRLFSRKTAKYTAGGDKCGAESMAVQLLMKYSGKVGWQRKSIVRFCR
jgi:hypothetical protein